MTNPNTKAKGGQLYTARFPGLVDIAEEEGRLVFVVMDRGKLEAKSTVRLGGVTYHPPPREQLPWAGRGMPQASAIREAFECAENPCYLAVKLLGYINALFVLPTPDYRFFIVVWTMHTYLADHPQVHHSGMIYLCADKERGKTRMLNALANLAYRADLTETLNEATLFRFAEYLGGTLLLDVSNVWERAIKRGADEFLLKRYERGAKVHRVKNPDATPFKDIVHYDVYGPTAIATNIAMPSVAESRCFPIRMPLSPGKYGQPDPQEGCRLRERLLAFRARMMEQSLPAPELIGTSRWADICVPLTQVAKEVMAPALPKLLEVFRHMEKARQELARDSLEAQIVQSIAELVDAGQVHNQLLEIKLIRERLGRDIESRFHPSPKRVGQILSALGFTKTTNRTALYCDQQLVQALRQQYGA